MSDPAQPRAESDPIATQAAAWVLRQDRGLSAAEQDELSAWLAADPRHGEQLARHRRHWHRLDRLAQWQPEHGDHPNPDLLAPPRRRRLPVTRWLILPVAAAAGLAVALIVLRPAREAATHRPIAATAGAPDSTEPRVLADGTVVDLNRGATLTTHYTADLRRVVLERGEAHFAVTKDPARPFIVQAGGVEVRAVGTAFNVRVDSAAVEVLVTEGKVRLDSAPATASPDNAPPPAFAAPVLAARQRAVVSRAAQAAPPQIATLTVREIAHVLAWQQRLLDFNASPLREIVAEFNRRNVVQLLIADPELATVRISATFRSDNIEGFVSLLEAGFGARAERRSDTEIVLHRTVASAKPR